MHWHARFSIAALSIIFLSFEFRQWQSRADRVLTQAFNMNFHRFGALEVRLTLTVFWLLTWTSNFHCFGALEVRQVRLALGQDSATCAGLAHGRDYRYCTRASEQKWQKVLGLASWPLFFIELSKIREKQWPTAPRWAAEVFSNLTRQTVVHLFCLCPDISHNALDCKSCSFLQVE